jgi:hypothetical protein
VYRHVKLVYESMRAGCLDALLSDESQVDGLVVTYVSDAVADLRDAAVALMKGAARGSVAWADEPGEHRWVLERKRSGTAANAERGWSERKR